MAKFLCTVSAKSANNTYFHDGVQDGAEFRVSSVPRRKMDTPEEAVHKTKIF